MSAATWGAKLRKQGFNPRVVSRLMKAATVLTVDESVMERLLDRLPADPIKLESICALSLAQIEELVTDNDCRQLDRNEVADLVRDKQGKKAPEKRELSPSETIRQSWAQFVEGLLNKIAAVESPDERDQVRHDLEASLDDLKESLQETDDDEGDDGEDKEDQEEADENEPDEEAAKAEAAKSAQQKGGKRRMQPA
jgi:hypothetical protein